MKLCICIVLVALFTWSQAIADPAAQTSRDPIVQALGQMLQEAQGREAQALARAYALQEQVRSLDEKLASQTKRAEEAEEKLPKP